jgi:hypothetical protein
MDIELLTPFLITGASIQRQLVVRIYFILIRRDWVCSLFFSVAATAADFKYVEGGGAVE